MDTVKINKWLDAIIQDENLGLGSLKTIEMIRKEMKAEDPGDIKELRKINKMQAEEWKKWKDRAEALEKKHEGKAEGPGETIDRKQAIRRLQEVRAGVRSNDYKLGITEAINVINELSDNK